MDVVYSTGHAVTTSIISEDASSKLNKRSRERKITVREARFVSFGSNRNIQAPAM